MAHSEPKIGSIGWADLTVENADAVRNFYADVIGWKPSPVDMGEYSDYNMCSPSTETPLAGVCHARGPNKDLPPVWLIYVYVENLDDSIERCLELGGGVISGPSSMGSAGRFCIIRDPAGAPIGLIEHGRT